jgi:FKBP-type peptidyl-prolyl cis-trans isomerase
MNILRCVGLATIVLVVSGGWSRMTSGQDKPPESLKEKASYLLGRDIAKDLSDRLIEYDLEQLVAGIRAAADGAESILSEEDAKSVRAAFGRELEKRHQEKMRAVADKNMREGLAYLKANALKDGVKQLENGLQYEILAEGEGDPPKITDRVKVHFVGSTVSGAVFERTTEAKEPPIVAVGAIEVRGLVDALMRMKPGAKWKVFVPPELAYGVDGAAPDIEPNQTLVFEVELIEVLPEPARSR